MPSPLRLLRGGLIWCSTRVFLHEAHQDEVDRSENQEDVGDIAHEESCIVNEVNDVSDREAWVTEEPVT